MARKKFGISPSVNKALTQTIQMAEAENSNFLNTEILVDRIALDPENPRKHKITLSDIKNGLSKKDPDLKEKELEHEGLCQLANSIQSEGLLHPIIVVEDANNFKLVAGERRFLASLIANRKLIEARVFKKKPKSFDLKVIQWSENQARKDLSLYKKLLNVQSILLAYEAENDTSMTAIKLSEVLGVSRQQAQFYKAILSNDILVDHIREGKVKTLEVARQLTNASKQEINNFIEAQAVIKSDSSLVKQPKVTARDKSKGSGRKRSSINLGATKQVLVAKTIVQAVLKEDNVKKYAADFKTTDWSCFDDSTKAFNKLLKILEKELGEKV